jgi:protein TonB
MNPTATINPFDRLGLTLFFAVSLHVALILGIGFDIWKNKPSMAERTLEIMVVQKPRKPEEPKQEDFLAQTSQLGGGNLPEKAKPQSPPKPILPPEPVKKPAPEVMAPAIPAAPPAPKPMAKPEPQPAAPPAAPKKVITSKNPDKKVVTAAPKPPVKKMQKLTAAQLLASTNREIARLSATLDHKTQEYAKRPRKKFISASTKEYKYANYLEAWRRKVERIGNLNYPDEARRRKLYGQLVLEVEVKPDGSTARITLSHSSGHKLLDDAAIRIVRLAAPFSPFPAEIRKETDRLIITRTWQFLSNNRLSSGK